MIVEWGGIVEDLALLNLHSQMCQDSGVWRNWGLGLLSSPIGPWDKFLSQLGTSRPSLGCAGAAAASVGWLGLSGLGFLVYKGRTLDPPAQVQRGASEWRRQSELAQAWPPGSVHHIACSCCFIPGAVSPAWEWGRWPSVSLREGHLWACLVRHSLRALCSSDSPIFTAVVPSEVLMLGSVRREQALHGGFTPWVWYTWYWRSWAFP